MQLRVLVSVLRDGIHLVILVASNVVCSANEWTKFAIVCQAGLAACIHGVRVSVGD